MEEVDSVRGEWIRGEWIKDTPTTEKKSEAERRMGISSEGNKLRSERERQVRGRRREGWCDGVGERRQTGGRRRECTFP